MPPLYVCAPINKSTMRIREFIVAKHGCTHTFDTSVRSVGRFVYATLENINKSDFEEAFPGAVVSY